ncbi:hypothetical protein MLD38_016367 [Melastoma candidum]|uniref:Uncharacterized protein n=1 Tax=Melastoma candidum TaxID=119954 RepID=A0ACB9RKD8_9MYRT|nr:hypothetical protein MLD38_016367 [Melastoma candidum]
MSGRMSTFFSSSSSSSSSGRRYHLRSDPYFGGHDESDVLDGDNSKVEYLCPFCTEEFDIVGLYCHVDEEHPVDVKSAVCPICGIRDGLDIVGHIITQHGNLFKVHRKRRLRKGGSSTTISLLRKELQDGTLQSLLRGTRGTSNPFSEPDPLLSSFMSSPTVEAPVNVESQIADEVSLVKDSSEEELLESNVRESLLPGEDGEERARKCKFVQGLFLSSFLDKDI